MRRPLLLLCLIYLCITFINVHIRGIPEYDFEKITNSEITVIGKVVDRDEANQVIYLKNITFCSIDDTEFYENDIVSANYDNYDKHNNIGAICYMAEYEDALLGSYVKIRGKAKNFKSATNPGEFDLREYYFINGYHFSLNNSEIIDATRGYSKYSELLRKIRNVLSDAVDMVFSDENSGIIKTMVLGDKTELNKDVKEMYQKTGISHILSISGLHVSLIGMFLYSLLKKMTVPVTIRTGVSASIMISYAKMTGASVSTNRAVMMFVILMIGTCLRRTYDITVTLALSATISVICNKYVMLYSGFWLSYMAVIGIAIFSKCVKPASFEKGKAFLNKIYPGVIVSYFSFPLILYYFYEYPLYSILINFIVILLVSLLLGIAILAIILYLLLSVFSVGIALCIGRWISIPCVIILRLYEMLCNISAALPGHMIIIGKPHLWQIILFYILCLILSIINMRIKGKIQIKQWLIILLLGILVVIPNKNNEICMIDVGQGDGIYISYGNDSYMIDGGTSNKSNLAKYTIVPFLKSKGVSSIQYWFISHPDSDHISGLIEILEDRDCGIEINNIVLPNVNGIQSDAKELLQAAYDRNVKVNYMAAGDYFKNDEMSFICLNPVKNGTYQDINEYSCVLLMQYNDFKMLFTGDATMESEEDVFQYCNMNNISIDGIDILKVGHHGSKSSTSEAFCNIIRPKYGLISVGKNNRYGHPNSDVLDRLSSIQTEIIRTDYSGCITIDLSENGYEVSVWNIY